MLALLERAAREGVELSFPGRRLGPRGSETRLSKAVADTLALTLLSRDGAHLKFRFREALLGKDASA